MIRRPPRSTQGVSSAASDVYKRQIQVRIPTPNQSGNVSVTMDVVYLDVPMLLRLRERRASSLLVDYLDNRLICKNDNWSVPLHDKKGHLYWSTDTISSYFSRAEIERLHRHFFHPSADKLYNLVKRSRLGQAQPGLRRLIYDVMSSCSECKEYSSKPFRFRASLPPPRRLSL